jgi:ATP-dependent Clp protease ATP-binding subunit ClpA
MLGRELEKTLRRALRLANERKHQESTVEHLLLALLDDPDARTALLACGADIELLRSELTEFLDHKLMSLPTEDEVDSCPTGGFHRIIQRAAIHVDEVGASTMDGADILVELFSDRGARAVYFIENQGLTQSDVAGFVYHR